jgi:predicted nucleic acid-binding protein
MADLVLDVGSLADLLWQSFQSGDYTRPIFFPSRFLSSERVRQLNRIVLTEGQYLVAASVVAFVELARKWDDIVASRFAPYQLAAFLQAPPVWFSVEPLDESVLPAFLLIPSSVRMPDGRVLSIEWIDAIHLATARSRERAILVTSDTRLQQLEMPGDG